MSNDRKCLSMPFPDGQTDDGGGEDFSDGGGGVADSDTPLLSSFFRSAFDSIMVGVVGDHGRASEERTERNEERDRGKGEMRLRPPMKLTLCRCSFDPPS